MKRTAAPVAACALGLILGTGAPAQTPQPKPSAKASASAVDVDSAVERAEDLSQLGPEIASDVTDAMIDVQDQLVQIQPMINTRVNVDLQNHISERISRDLARIEPKIALNMPFRFQGLTGNQWQGSWEGNRAEGEYREGTRAIDRHDYEKAIAAMDKVIAAKSSRADGAYYWKAYAQSKLGRTSDALATLAALERTFPKSAWLKDAKALEVVTRQNAGQRVSPDSESNDDLKLLAINGLMHSDPAQATPLVEKVLNDPKNTPKVRERALFVLARSNSPEARQTVARFAEGSANPDLQMRAIQFLAATDAKGDTGVFTKIYNQASDAAVKRSALQAMFIRQDRNALASVAKTESNVDLRRQAVNFLGALGATDVLLNLYRNESNSEVKRNILDALSAKGDGKDLVQLARHESDPTLKRAAVERLSTMDSKEAKDYMLELLGK
jgi:TolA-binding protein